MEEQNQGNTDTGGKTLTRGQLWHNLLIHHPATKEFRREDGTVDLGKLADFLHANQAVARAIEKLLPAFLEGKSETIGRWKGKNGEDKQAILSPEYVYQSEAAFFSAAADVKEKLLTALGVDALPSDFKITKTLGDAFRSQEPFFAGNMHIRAKKFGLTIWRGAKRWMHSCWSICPKGM